MGHQEPSHFKQDRLRYDARGWDVIEGASAMVARIPFFGFQVVRARSEAEHRLALELRESIYREAGKVAEVQAYRSPMDPDGEVFVVLRDGFAIGTFSIYRHRRGGLIEEMVSRLEDAKELGDHRAIFVYFLGLRRSERTAAALKFVFGEIFKFLVRDGRDTILISADARLAKKYRWIGFERTGVSVQGPFPKSGALQLMRTKQTRFGLYGLHADPFRWNVYLREPTRELLAEGRFRNPHVMRLLYGAFGLFARPARVYERLLARVWKTSRSL